MLQRGYIFKSLITVRAAVAVFTQLFAKMPAYDSSAAHDVHCWGSPPSVQSTHELMLIRDRMREDRTMLEAT
jgi:hypothetical protein